MRSAARLATDHEALRDSAMRRARRVKQDLQELIARGRRDGSLGQVGSQLLRANVGLLRWYVAIARVHNWQAIRVFRLVKARAAIRDVDEQNAQALHGFWTRL